MDDELKMIIIISFFAIIIPLVIVLGCSVLSDIIHCSAVGKTLNYKTEWHYWTGCVVEKSDGSRVLLEQMRDMEK